MRKARTESSDVAHSYAVRLMQDVYFLEWRVDPGLITPKQESGYIQTQKATSGLYAPLAGRLLDTLGF